MKIAAITNSRIPSLTANSIQAMQVAQALTQLGHDVRVFAPREARRVSPEALASHYGLQVAPRIRWLPSLRVLKRLDFVLLAHIAARLFRADLVYTWLPQSAVVAAQSG